MYVIKKVFAFHTIIFFITAIEVFTILFTKIIIVVSFVTCHRSIVPTTCFIFHRQSRIYQRYLLAFSSRSFFLSFFLFSFFFVNVVLISSGSVQVRPPCPEAKDVLNNIIGLVNAVTKVAASKGCGKAVGKMHFCFCMGQLPVTTHETLVTLHEPPVFVLFWFLFLFCCCCCCCLLLIRTSFVNVVSSQFLFWFVPFSFDIVSPNAYSENASFLFLYGTKLFEGKHAMFTLLGNSVFLVEAILLLLGLSLS